MKLQDAQDKLHVYEQRSAEQTRIIAELSSKVFCATYANMFYFPLIFRFLRVNSRIVNFLTSLLFTILEM